MMRTQFQHALCLLAIAGSSWVSVSAQAQDEAGESANFAALADPPGEDMAMLEPACMNCGTMVVASSPGLKAGGDAAPAVASMEDSVMLEFMAERPDFVAAGPDPVVAKIDGEADGIETSVTTEMVELKAGRLGIRTRLRLKVNPKKRAMFPKMGDADACDPLKAYNKKQRGWQRLRMASAFKTKKGRFATTKARPVMICVRTPANKPATCGLSCGEGSCDHEYTGGKWVEFCDCKPGYAFKAGSCTDVNECMAGATCPKGTACENKPGNWACGCANGQVLTPAGCKTPPPMVCPGVVDGKCTGDRFCRRTPTTTSCQCEPNKVFSDGACQPRRACAIDGCGNGKGIKCLDASTQPAPVPAIAPGEYQCGCPTGTVYQASKKPGKGMCVDINECKLANVKAYCGASRCRNLDLVSPGPKPDGAVCGTAASPLKLPPAPSVSSMWSMGTKSWE